MTSPKNHRSQLDKKIVVNLSSHQRTWEETVVVVKGRNFAITPGTVPSEESISSFEAAIRVLPLKDIKREASRILQSVRLPKTNISGNERQAISNLNANRNVIILPAA